MPRRFPFEAGFFDTLAWMPMCVRRSLDLARVKLSLRAWEALPLEERVSLRDARVESAADAEAFRSRVRALAAAAGVDAPDTAGEAPRWRDPAAPRAVRTALSAFGASLDDARWARLDDEARYVLFHLAAKKGDDRRLEEACVTLGLHERAAA